MQLPVLYPLLSPELAPPSRKIALKCLKHSDLTIFKRYFDTTPRSSKQKAINLDAAVLVHLFFPALRGADASIPVQLNVQGPGVTSVHQVLRYIRKQSKNWRLEGTLIDDPQSGDSSRYGLLKPDDLALIEFVDGPDGMPVRVDLILLSATHDDDKAVHAALRELLISGGVRGSMVGVSPETLTKKLEGTLPEIHPVCLFLSGSIPDVNDEKPTEEKRQPTIGHSLDVMQPHTPPFVGHVKSGTFAGVAYEEVRPEAAAFVETLRAIGYSPETAVADLIDNSITAGASTISVDFQWAGADSVVLISDDGHGMTERGLVNAMRPGSKNPLQERSSNDLGRFGLGLKTASFSQCRRLTVLSKSAEDDKVNYRCWDLNHIAATDDWHLLTWVSDDTLVARLESQLRGTIVVWELADRLAGRMHSDKGKDLNKFNQIIERVQWHLEMTFHRYLQQGLIIKINGAKLTPWDPFLAGRKGTQRLPDEELDEEVTVTPYVLPHHRMFENDEECARAGRVKGWNGHQGFYIYRNDRLLVAGDWLGMFPRDEHHRLARIAISLPASLDQDWQIDIRKARARPPFWLRERLQAVAKVTRTRAADVYRSRGPRLQKLTGTSDDVSPVWMLEVKEGRTRYRINREHLLIQSVLNELNGSPEAKKLKDILRLVEESIPTSQIAMTVSEANGAEVYPFDDDEGEAFEMMLRIYKRKRAAGHTPSEARQYVSCIDPFHRKPHLLEQLAD
ncbi:ATP-binding protein [Hymenobacter sp. UYP22]|uniref:ATP-binding protein n=1 Tax=Hymenobacter sp. UYP22 TaxID=3156348 RepID=UPI0033927514